MITLVLAFCIYFSILRALDFHKVFKMHKYLQSSLYEKNRYKLSQLRSCRKMVNTSHNFESSLYSDCCSWRTIIKL